VTICFPVATAADAYVKARGYATTTKVGAAVWAAFQAGAEWGRTRAEEATDAPPPIAWSPQEPKPMTIPAVMFLEIALEALKTRAAEVPTWPPLIEGGPLTTTLDREVKEFRMLGEQRLTDLGLALGQHARDGSTPDLTNVEAGYLLGLEVCRVLLALQPDAVRAGVTL